MKNVIQTNLIWMYHILVMVPVIIIIYVTGVEVNKE